MARPIGQTPKLNKRATRKFLNRIARDQRKRVGPIATPKIDKAIEMIMSDADNRQK